MAAGEELTAQATGEGGMIAEDDVTVAEDDVSETAGVPAPDMPEQVAKVETAPVPPEETAPVAAPARPEPQAERPASPAGEGGMMSYLLYALGAALVAVLGFVFLRRRGDKEAPAAETASAAPAKDVFADVKLKEQPLQVEPPAEEQLAPAEEEAPEPEGEQRDNRGYGERKHDEYASDVDAGDALAEADIYIAYGRFPQAIDLLNNALNNEPGNAAYRLKLLGLYAETGDTAAAAGQLEELKAIGDADAIERGEAVLADMSGTQADDDAKRFIEPESAAEAPPVDLADESEAPLQSDFSGLAIEEPDADTGTPDDLDLSADFSDKKLSEGEDEELVIAADSNGLSTKLDLARAYLDMGDEDGARQILEEVIAEGGDEIKAEASALLERIG
jgi:pilus assembly protein FimV